MIVYVFLVQRKQDKEPWPNVFESKLLADNYRDRVSPVMALNIPVVPKEGEAWLCLYVLNFVDGGIPAGVLIHRGTKEDCRKFADMGEPLRYMGDREVKEAHFIVVAESAASPDMRALKLPEVKLDG